jgi:hypothetical protein
MYHGPAAIAAAEPAPEIAEATKEPPADFQVKQRDVAGILKSDESLTLRALCSKLDPLYQFADGSVFTKFKAQVREILSKLGYLM